jgi:hypothetical protein
MHAAGHQARPACREQRVEVRDLGLETPGQLCQSAWRDVLQLHDMTRELVGPSERPAIDVAAAGWRAGERECSIRDGQHVESLAVHEHVLEL